MVLARTTLKKPRLTVFVGFDGMRAVDLVGPLDAFSLAGLMPGPALPQAYDLCIASERGGIIPTSSGLAVATQSFAEFDDVAIDTIVVAGGASALRMGASPAMAREWLDTQRALTAWLAKRRSDVRRICSVCTGTFLLGAAGVIDERAVTTHWGAAGLLAECFPRARVEPDRIFVQDGPVWTSGGVTSGIDLALALIEEDLGPELVLKVARAMVIFVKRPGGQSQYSVPLAAQVADRGNFGSLHAWMWEHLAEDLRVEDLAQQAGMSRRTFMRSYAAATGSTPARMLESMRLDAARVALESTRRSLKQIARETGFGDAERMRRAFMRQLGVAPADYRARFSSVSAAVGG